MLPVFDKAFREEAQLVYNVLTHPAGFHLGVFGTLEVRPTDQGVYEVAWEPHSPESRRVLVETVGDWRMRADSRYWRLYKSPLRAAVVFCHLRRALELGVDHDAIAIQLAAVTGS